MNPIPILFLLFSIFTFIRVEAQEVVDEMAKETCVCLEEEGLQEGLSEEELQMKVGLCMMQVAPKYVDRIRSELNIDLYNDGQEAGQKLGEKIGMRLTVTCPLFLESVVKSQMGKEGGNSPGMKAKMVLEGTFRGMESGQFNMLLLDPVQGKRMKFLWLEHFPGADRLVTNPKTLEGKKIRIEFVEEEYFAPALQDYVPFRRILGLEVL